ncbi:MAG: N-acetylglutaminylglutamine amidotransferase [Phycisphaeraceae bacterium]
MCGICGELVSNGAAASAGAVQAMTDRMTRRGPDSRGLFWHDHAALGHCRLKIIDLSEAAHQPMIDSELGLTLVFNGCIYNYPDLRQQLKGKGYRFFSHSDTEVILKAYHAWGAQCVEKFNGMFALAIWERDTDRLVLARDRLGIKPLYYAKTDTGLRFASSLPALVGPGGVDTSIDPVALHHYMSWHSVVPAPYTILKGVRKLKPATVMTIEANGDAHEHEYWQPVFNPEKEERKYSLEDWKQRVLHELGEAIRRRMIADVPVGVLLSGGLDSSLVVGMLAQQGQQGLETFSVGFESVGGEAGDEFKYSDVVAERFDTVHHKIRVDTDRTLTNLEPCIRAMSEPMVSHDAIGFYLLSEKVSKHVKVVQSGQGADEVFAGYHWYPPMMDSTDAVADYARNVFDRDHAEYAETVDKRFVDEDFSREYIKRHFDMPGADAPIDKALRLDTTVMLIDDPVKRVDNMTMAWGLEARVPFLDHELVELAGRIPAKFKVKNDGKFVLKEAAREVIPWEVIDRPKGYFPVPALKYLQGEYLEKVRDVLMQPAAKQRNLYSPKYVEKMLADPEKHITPLRGSKLWQLALLEYWLQLNDL